MKEDINKTSFWKSNWYWFLLLFLITIVVPYIINCLILSEKYWDVVGEGKDWLAFWPSYLSSIASAIMIGYTAITLKNNKQQLDELKRQWFEEHKPSITVSYNMIENVAYLRLVNTSKVEITNLTITGDFYFKEEKNNSFDLTILEQFNINIEPHGIRNIVLHYNIVPLSSDYYFIIQLNYNETEQKIVKVYCNDVYSVGDDIIWKKLIENIKKMR